MICFPATYEEARDRFVRSLELVRQKWPRAQLESQALKEHPALSIDWIQAEPSAPENLIFVSSGEHGIEGYLGAAVLNLFIEDMLPRLDAEKTGLILVHALNPWGMKHYRKVNANGVDLNRNFTYKEFDSIKNPDFEKLKRLINPQQPMRTLLLENILFGARLAKALLTAGSASISNATLYGQSICPNGIYFGGDGLQEETFLLMSIFRAAFEKYQTILCLDMHSGYGPSRPMNLSISSLEPLSSMELSRKFAYPLVLKVASGEFYAIAGDMIDYFYRVHRSEYPERTFFACSFEFGTFGSSMLQRIRSLRAMVFENQVNWFGAKNKSTAELVRREFRELYFPSDAGWQEKALGDGRRAFEGILCAYGLLI
jgi:hypothetical protein